MENQFEDIAVCVTTKKSERERARKKPLNKHILRQMPWSTTNVLVLL